jgi:hypothetical protein
LTALSDPGNFQPVVLETIDGVETKTPLKDWFRKQADTGRAS